MVFILFLLTKSIAAALELMKQITAQLNDSRRDAEAAVRFDAPNLI
jgi:hypothetical protein